MQDDLTIPKGIYKHFKGKMYLVEDIARHSETLDYCVVYRALYGEYGLWIRPLDMFLEEVEVDGKKVRRFEYSQEF
jgi:cyclomaltodextrinase